MFLFTNLLLSVLPQLLAASDVRIFLALRRVSR
jgi:hypothetical protein